MRIAAQHKDLQEFVAKWQQEYLASGRKVFCRQGCAGCCSLAVHATFPEAMIVAAGLSAGHHSKLQSYLERLKGAVPGLTDLKGYLKMHRREIGPCPFLDAQGACSIYKQRPLSCRALLSTRPADWCTVDFSLLTEWDKQAYRSSLDRTIVAWPTHFVAATQERARGLEADIITGMLDRHGWCLTGNFPLMVWLATQLGGDVTPASSDRLRELLAENRFNSGLLATFHHETASGQENL